LKFVGIVSNAPAHAEDNVAQCLGSCRASADHRSWNCVFSLQLRSDFTQCHCASLQVWEFSAAAVIASKEWVILVQRQFARYSASNAQIITQIASNCLNVAARNRMQCAEASSAPYSYSACKFTTCGAHVHVHMYTSVHVRVACPVYYKMKGKKKAKPE
jgi:hypothetical protein